MGSSSNLLCDQSVYLIRARQWMAHYIHHLPPKLSYFSALSWCSLPWNLPESMVIIAPHSQFLEKLFIKKTPMGAALVKKNLPQFAYRACHGDRQVLHDRPQGKLLRCCMPCLSFPWPQKSLGCQAPQHYDKAIPGDSNCATKKTLEDENLSCLCCIVVWLLVQSPWKEPFKLRPLERETC